MADIPHLEQPALGRPALEAALRRAFGWCHRQFRVYLAAAEGARPADRRLRQWSFNVPMHPLRYVFRGSLSRAMRHLKGHSVNAALPRAPISNNIALRETQVNSKRRTLSKSVALALTIPVLLARHHLARAVNLVGFGGTGCRLVTEYAERHEHRGHDYVALVERASIGGNSEFSLDRISTRAESIRGPLLWLSGSAPRRATLSMTLGANGRPPTSGRFGASLSTHLHLRAVAVLARWRRLNVMSAALDLPRLLTTKTSSTTTRKRHCLPSTSGRTNPSWIRSVGLRYEPLRPRPSGVKVNAVPHD